MTGKALSIIIPTFNRCAILQRALEALLRQDTGPDEYEIIVVDDGSSDDTGQVVSALKTESPVGVRYLYQENQGPGAARNYGLREATGTIVLFVDDDVIAVPFLVSEHLRHHRLYPSDSVAVLGQMQLAPEIPRTPLNLRHLVYRWPSLVDGQELDWQYFITCNISLKRAFLAENALWFDEGLARLAQEDTEIGYRCSMRGLRILYNAQALGYHDSDLMLQGYLRMCQRYGRALAVIHHMYPELRGKLGEHLCFSWRNPPLRLARDVLRPFLLNRVTVAGLLPLARYVEKHSGVAPSFLSRRVGSFYEREGYHTQWRELKRGW